MTLPTEVRCTGRYPGRPNWECRAKLTEVYPGTVEVTRKNGHLPTGCSTLTCTRCGAVYVVCPTRAVA